MNKWASSSNKKASLKIFHVTSWNIPQHIHLPHGNNIWCGKIFHALSRNILPHDMRDLLWNQQWFIDFTHGFANIVVDNSIMWRFEVKKKYKDVFLSFLMQPMLQKSRDLIHTIEIHGLSNHTTWLNDLFWPLNISILTRSSNVKWNV
jgi:hypothetical protein